MHTVRKIDPNLLNIWKGVNFLTPDAEKPYGLYPAMPRGVISKFPTATIWIIANGNSLKAVGAGYVGIGNLELMYDSIVGNSKAHPKLTSNQALILAMPSILDLNEKQVIDWGVDLASKPKEVELNKLQKTLLYMFKPQGLLVTNGAECIELGQRGISYLYVESAKLPSVIFTRSVQGKFNLLTG